MVSVRKGFVVTGLFLVVSVTGWNPAFAKTTQPGTVLSAPEAALASAASPAAFARIARQSPLASYSVRAGDAGPVNFNDPNQDADASSSMSTSALPEAPQPVHDNYGGFFQQTARTSSHYTKYIPAGWSADKITAHDKVIVGARDLCSVSNFLAIIASAGYEHVTNGEPNYGSDGDAFAKRVGAAAIRETSQGIFTDMVFSPLLHQDPRYFQEGTQYGFVHRTLYAITRPLITRTDSGHSTVNASLLLGYAVATAITPAYYPQSNRNFHDTASTYGGSIGGAALGFFVSEFTDDVLKTLHMKK